MRFLKSVHGWLGVVLLPSVMMIGLTGLFLNHEGLVLGWLDGAGYDEAQFDAWPDAEPMTVQDAEALVLRLYPGEAAVLNPDTVYHKREVATFDVGRTQVIVALKTGHYWVKSDFRRVTHAPDGTVLERKTYWEAIFKRLHERGWLSSRFGSWLADLTAAAMVVFGLSGMILFFVPRVRRWRNRRRNRAQMAV